MDQSGSTGERGKSCPVCGQEGRSITCTSGGKSEAVFYHPKKISHTICRIATAGDEKKSEPSDRETGKQNETDIT
jgi:hypothetical protein